MEGKGREERDDNRERCVKLIGRGNEEEERGEGKGEELMRKG